MLTGLHAVWSALRASWSLVLDLALPRARGHGATVAPAHAMGAALAARFALALVLFSPSPASAQLTTSAQLNGAGSFAMPALPALGRAVTIEGWVFPRSHSSWQRIVDIGNGTAINNIVLVASEETTGRPNFSVLSGSVTAPNPIPLNTWTHVAGVVDSDRTLRLYINGQLVASSVASSQVDDVARSSNLVGRSNWPGESPLNGSLADVRVWSTARTQAQIQAGMTVGSISGATSGLVAAYPFGATGQPVLNDVSGNNRTLTPSGSIVYQTAGPASPLTGPADDVIVADLVGSAHLTIPTLPAMGVPITMEAWVFPRSVVEWGRIIEIAADGGTGASSMVLYTSGDFPGRPNFTIWSRHVSWPLYLNAPNPLPLHTWSHVAAVVDSDRSARLYVNGQVVASGTSSELPPTVGRTFNLIGKADTGDGNTMFGDVRVWNTARTQAQIQATMAVGSVTGPATGLVAAYPFGQTGQPSLNDVSGNNRTLIPSGSVRFTSTGPTPPRTSSAWSDGASGSFMSMGSTVPVTGAFTVEGWVRPTSYSQSARLVDYGGSSDNILLVSSQMTSGRPEFIVNRAGSAVLGLTAPDALPLNMWSHVAGVINADRSSALYVNGRLVASGTATQLPNVTGTLSGLIGGNRWGGTSVNGGMADVRIWSVGRTQAEIQSAMPVGSISGAVTGLVAAYPFGATGQWVFNDVSGNNRTLTGSGNVQFQILGPSSPPAAAADAMVTADLKGSGYYTMGALPAWRDFTIEAWVNPRGYQGFGRIVDLGNAGYPNDNLLLMFADGSATKPVFWVFYGTDASYFQVTAPDPIPLNAWSHIAGTIDSGGVMRVFVNGRQVASGTAPRPANLVARSSNRIGASHDPTIFNGSIADVRIWNYPRTEAQIQSTLPVGSISGPAVGLMRAYPLGSTGADVLSDITLSGSTLTQVGSPEYRKTGPGFLSAQGFQGSASLVTSAGQLTLPGNNTYTGTTTIGGGAVQVGTGGTTGSLGTGNVSNSGILTFDRSDNFTVANAISGPGSLFKQGAGALTLSGPNSFTGGLTVRSGSVALTGDIANNAGNAITVNSGATFSINRNDTLGGHDTTPLTPFVVQSGAILQAGDGVFNVMGPITLRGGTLRATSGRATASGWSFALRGTVTVDGGATTSVLEGPGMALGATAVSSGTFDVADGSAADDLVVSGGLINGPASAFPNMQASGLVKTGAGRMTLTGTNAYTGTTTISAGTLQVGAGGTTGTLGSGNVVNNATLTFNRSDAITVANAITGTGTLVQDGTGTVTFGNARPGGGTLVRRGTLRLNGIRTLTAGAITLQPGTSLLVDGWDSLGYDNDPPWVTTVTVNEATVTMAGGPTQSASTDFILNGGRITGTVTWGLYTGTPANNTASVSTLASATTSVIDANTIAFGQQAVTFDVADGAANPDLRVSSVASGTGGLVKAGAGLMVLSGNNTYSGVSTISAGTLQVGAGGTTGTLGTGNVVNNATLTFNRSDSLTVANAISGTGTLTQQGAGTLVLSGANSYSGSSTISSGTVQVGAGGSAGSLGSGNVVNNSALVLNRNDAFTVANVISGTGTLTVQGGGIATLTGANTYSGVSTITAGTLQVGNGGTTGALGSGNVVNSGTLAFHRSDNITVANVVSGTGGLRKQGNGTLTLSAANTFSGATEVTGGTLALGASGTLGTSSTITLSGGAALDVTARSAGLVLPTGRTLANTGGSATLRGNIDASAPTLSMSFDGTNPSFSVVNGTLTLAANTPVQITKSGSALMAGQYKVISKGSGGTVAGVVPAAVTVTGAGGLPTTLFIVNGELILQVGTPVTIAIGNLAQSYNATPRPVSITTTPASIATAVTYNGGTTVPTAVGTYAVAATVTAPGFYGSASGSLVISKGLAVIRLGNLFQNYDGTARRALAVTEPSGLTVGFTYNGTASAPTNQGIYNVVATISDPNYMGSTNGTLRIRPATPGSLAAPTSQPPAYVNHQGFLSDSSGTPLGSPNPRNYDLIFRIYSAPSGGSSLWTEFQNVTLDQGRYSVMLGDGQNVGIEPWPKIDSVLASGAGSARYIQVTVRGIGVGGSDVTIMPRFLLASQPYAFLARHATTTDMLVDSNGVPVIRVSGNSVGVNVEQPNAMFDVGGVLAADSVSTPGNAIISGTLTATSFVGRGTFPLGTIVVWTGGNAPTGWAICDGRTVNGRRTPDLRSRFVVGQGQGPGLSSRSLGQTGGEEAVTLSWLNMGQHNHIFDPGPTISTSGGNHSHGYDTGTAYGSHPISVLNVNRGDNVTWTRGSWVNRSMDHGDGNHAHAFSVSAWSSVAGDAQPHPNMPPFYVLAYIMRVQ